MAYTYSTGTANDTAHWFTLLEAFLVGVGWTVVSGSGTTTIVFSSIGEAGGRSKLFIRFRRHATLLQMIYYRVQDDGAGTHTTTDGGDADVLVAPGVGTIPFEFWMGADKDKVIVNIKAGAGYTGCYVGIVEPFALSVDEEEQMISVALQEMDDTAFFGYVLKADDGAWDQSIKSGECEDEYMKDPLDSSVTVFALRCHETTFNKIVGQPTDVSGRIRTLAGVNPEDIITTGYVGATSTWVVMGTGTHRWCMRTGGNIPVGQLEGAYFAHTNGLALNITDFEAKLLAFMTAIGWTKVANPSPVHPIDYFWYSQGESGVDDIYIHWYYKATGAWEFSVADDTALTHESTYTRVNMEAADFPTYYYITGDRDCLLVVMEKAGLYEWGWAGMYQMFLPDPDSYATPYKVGTELYILRDHAGLWNQTLAYKTDGAVSSSPNLYDGVTNVVWQYVLFDGTLPIGIAKYLHFLDSTAYGIMDTVAIGGRSFRLFVEISTVWRAFREA